MICSWTVPSQPITGFSKVLSNMGQLQNTGFELTLNANIMRRKNFEGVLQVTSHSTVVRLNTYTVT